jgi:SulP family sulfate permease
MTILVVVAMMLGVPDILSYMPKAILVGLIIFSALELFYEWLYQAFWRLPYEDYLLILSIFLTAIFFGFMISIVLGVLLASAFFLVKYSRINNVKYEITGKEFRSKHKYPYSVEQYLRRVGKRTLILKLQGYLFFGSSRRLLEHIYYILKEARAGHYVNLILDFHLVPGLDISSVVNFITIGEIAKKYQVQYLISSARKDVKDQFTHMSSRQWLDQNILFMPSLDYALEWCESRYLIGAETDGEEDITVLFNKPENQEIFLQYLRRKDVRAGTYLFRQGEPSDSLYFLQKGQVTAFITGANNQTIRLFTTESNVLLGEMGFFSGHPRSATIVSDTACTLFELTIPTLNKIEEDHPELIIEFYESVIQLLSDRINELNIDLELFQR